MCGCECVGVGVGGWVAGRQGHQLLPGHAQALQRGKVGVWVGVMKWLGGATQVGGCGGGQAAISWWLCTPACCAS